MKLIARVKQVMKGKARLFGTLGGLALAGAAMTAATPAANAQVSFGVSVGRPGYYAPAPRPVYVAPYGGYYGYRYAPERFPGYAERWRHDEWRAHEWREREYWHGYRPAPRPYGYGWR